jgi:hypothetical protein
MSITSADPVPWLFVPASQPQTTPKMTQAHSQISRSGVSVRGSV